jgi:hypothetical protein
MHLIDILLYKTGFLSKKILTAADFRQYAGCPAAQFDDRGTSADRFFSSLYGLGIIT